mmetsp:Transcript_34281/g.66788  ORF Transcript_34281/g.66788 Transcript_34281/m.66788 type:complete len:199 (+) Transcript_34281:34-630(+)
MSVLVEQVSDIQALSQVDGKQLAKCCEICMHNFKNGAADKKIYLRAAKEMGLSSTDVAGVVDSLSGLFIASCKKQMKQGNFKIFMETLQLPQGHTGIIYKYYAENVQSIRQTLQNHSKRLSSYKSLSWRLEIETSTRSLHHEVKPSFLLELQTEKMGEPHSELMQCDYSVLKNMCNELELALNELDSSHCRRMSTYIN